MIRISFETLEKTYRTILIKRGMDQIGATALATSFATMAWEGTYSHGINRFPVFISQVDNGDILLSKRPKKISSLGALEQWDCQYGPGPLNGSIGIKRTIELANTHGVGVVALRNSNHWMRGGTYALYAARKGYASIAITNSIAVVPAWGGVDHRIGTNPLIIAIPGNPPALLDMSCSQYSYGKLEVAKLAGSELTVPGGYDKDGNLSYNPNAIGESGRLLPAGYWKGSGLAIVLDMLVTILSGGNSTAEITEDTGIEKGVSQLLIAFDTTRSITSNELYKKLTRIVEFTKKSILVDKNNPVRIPGENIEKFIQEHGKNGIPIDESIWKKIQAL